MSFSELYCKNHDFTTGHTFSENRTYIYHIMDFAELQIVKMSSRAVVPTRATKYSIGLDLHSPDNYLIRHKKQVLIPTQIKCGIPPGYYGRIASKSRLAIKNQVHVVAGIIDPDYTGEIKVLLINNSKHYYQVKEGEAIAQLILEKACIPILKQVKELPATKRGDRGCGSHSPGDSPIYIRMFNLLTKNIHVNLTVAVLNTQEMDCF